MVFSTSSPVGIHVARLDVLVQLVGGFGLQEWELTCYNREQDHASGEDVSMLALVGLFFQDLGSCVHLSTFEVVEVINVFVGSIAKVCELEVKILINQNILQLQVTMHDSTLMQIFDCCKDLSY